MNHGKRKYSEITEPEDSVHEPPRKIMALDENETYGASLAKNQQAQESLNLNRAKFEFDKQKHKDNLELKQQQKTK